MFDFGARLRELREFHHMSQEELGRRINKSKSVISSYENNLKIPSVDILTSLAVIYNVSLDYLAGIERQEAIILTALTEQQRHILSTIVLEFRETKRIAFRGLSPRQVEILSNLLVEFSYVDK